MPSRRLEAVQRLWHGHDPFVNREAFTGREDYQGWASQHGYLTECVLEVKPSCIVEVGVWKGGSTITLAEAMRQVQPDSVIISVDTWLGSSEHWLDPSWFSHLCFFDGYPTLYKTFCANIIGKNLNDFVVPLPLDSLNAAELLKKSGISPGIIHIDGGHDFQSVLSDLRVWWPLLASGGLLIGDDYHPESVGVWPEVREAFHSFFGAEEIENKAGKCIIRKHR